MRRVVQWEHIYQNAVLCSLPLPAMGLFGPCIALEMTTKLGILTTSPVLLLPTGRAAAVATGPVGCARLVGHRICMVGRRFCAARMVRVLRMA